jgi:hypothetical protein
MLNWRPVREIDLEIEQIKQRTKLIENETELIEKETEQLRRENARLNLLNAKTRHLISCVDQLCFPPECSSTLPKPTDPDCGPSSP